MKPVYIIKRYKIPFLISLVVALAVITFGYENTTIGAILTFVASIIAMFLTDLGTILHAYIVDPSTDESQIVRDSLKVRDFNAFFEFISDREYQVENPTVKSVLFQLLLMVFVFYSALGGIDGFAKAFVFSFAGCLLYFQMVEFQKTKTLKRWFWIYKGNLSRQGYIYYIIALTLLYILFFTFV